MTERKRLIGLLKNAPRNTRVFYDQFADYLLANGVIVPPCKVGGVVYSVCDCINRPEKLFVTAIHQYEKYMSFSALSRSQRKYVFEEADICKTVFLTKEEAEQALRKEDVGK